jgi:hypothetical protein
MVINTNMTGTSGTPLAKAGVRTDSDSKNTSPSAKPSSPATLDSEISGIFAGAGSDIDDGEAAGRSIQLARASMLGQPATAMLAQANLSPETVFNLLQA